MDSIITENLNIQFRQGGGGAIPVVFIHGNYASSRWWQPQLERLPITLRGIAPDLRGCGSPRRTTQVIQKETGQLTIQNLSDDIFDLVSALELDKVFLVGHSLGGIIAVDFALRYPDNLLGIILEDTGPPNGLPSGILTQSLFLPLEFGSKILMRNTLRLAGIPRKGELAKALVEDALSATQGQYLAFSKAVSSWQVEHELSNIHIPVLLIWGGKDRIMPPTIGKQYLHLLNQAEMVIFPNCGHSPHLERPNAFSKVLIQFIENCLSNSKQKYDEIQPKKINQRITQWIQKIISY